MEAGGRFLETVPLFQNMGTNKMKKIGKFLTSMPFAIGLLIVLAIACGVSSTIQQGLSYEAYAAQYGERTAGLILGLQLDDAFHSRWFAGLSILLCLDLLFCNLIRLPALIRRFRKFADSAIFHGVQSTDAAAVGTGDPNSFFRAMSFPSPKITTGGDGQEIRYSVRNRIGLWGAWICHLGIFLLILGFSMGQMLSEEYTVYGLPGQTKPMGETGFQIQINDFRTELHEDGSPIQYTASLTMTDSQGDRQAGTASVNAPASLFGYRIYQNSYGWGADVRITRNGTELQREALCAGEILTVEDEPDLAVFFQAFYPDYAKAEGSSPYSLSEQLNNPAYLYRVYYAGQFLGMNVLTGEEKLTVDDYVFSFENPRRYTLLVTKRDPFSWLVLLGATVTLAGLVLVFYLRPAVCWAVLDGNNWTVYGRSRKESVFFRERFEQAAGKTGFAIQRRIESGNGPEADVQNSPTEPEPS